MFVKGGPGQKLRTGLQNTHTSIKIKYRLLDGETGTLDTFFNYQITAFIHNILRLVSDQGYL